MKHRSLGRFAPNATSRILSRIVTAVTILILVLCIEYARAEPAPTFYDDTRTLTIPAVDAPAIPGLYQDVVFRRGPQNAWELVSFRKAERVAFISDVQVILTEEVPVQAFVKASGRLPDACHQLGQIITRPFGNSFEVELYYNNPPTPPEPRFCTQAIVPFTQIIPLPVYGLEAGLYTWIVNDRFFGRFTLNAVNTLE